MRLPFPERIPPLGIFSFCVVLCTLQLFEGTSPVFTLGTLFVVILSACAFNMAGGLTSPSGGYVFAFALLTSVLGIVFKVIYNEPGESHLLQPDRTIEVYVGTSAAMLAAVYLSRRLRFRSFLPKFESNEDLYRASVGCCFVGTVIQVITLLRTAPVQAGSLFAALQQLNTFTPLAIVLGVIYQVRKSNGRSSLNLPVVVGFCVTFAGGLLFYSKQGFFAPMVAWLLPAAANRYKVSVAQLGGLVVALGLVVYYLVPYSQVGRAYRVPGAPFSLNLATSMTLLSHLDKVRDVYNQAPQDVNPLDQNFSYYSQQAGFAERLQMLSVDDALINATENGSVFGLFPTLFYFENIIPHFIWPSKPIIGFGNLYAHEVGILTNDEDTTTGISFSAAGDAYHQAKWVGTLLVLPALFTLLFTLSDSFGGDTRESPFALLMMIGFLHTAPEGQIGGLVSGSTTSILVIYVGAAVTVYVMPLIANLVIGPAKQKVLTVRSGASLRSRL